MRIRRIGPALGIALVLALAGCASAKKKPAADTVERPVSDIYNEAVDALQAETYKTAAKRFDDVERQHPYSVWATKAQLMAAFANYKANDYDEAVIDLNRFIQLHPGNRDIAYAYYLRALCYYEQISDVVRDQGTTEQAYSALQEVVRRFPSTEYARDARLKIDLTRDHLAGKEMQVGRYYLKRGYYLAAINRFRRVVDQYQTTSHVPEALHRLVECYLSLGLTDEARKTAAVLGHNYPGSRWYADSYADAMGKIPPDDKGGFLARTFNSVF